MPFFSATVAAMAAGRSVQAAILVHFDFATQPMWVWTGFGELRTIDDRLWQGIGQLGSITGLERAIGMTSPVTTFMLSGVDPALIAATLDASDEVKGRDVTVFLQFLNDALAPVDLPYAVYAGVLDVMGLTVTGPNQATIEVTSESIFARRGAPLWGNLSDRDQNRLYPGDRGLEAVPQIPFKRAVWPIINP